MQGFLHIKNGKSWSRKYCVLRSSGLYVSKTGEPKKGKKVSFCLNAASSYVCVSSMGLLCLNASIPGPKVFVLSTDLWVCLFTTLPRPGDSEGTFRFSPSLLNVRQGSCECQFLLGLTRLGIEPEFTVSVANALSTKPPISYQELLIITLRY